MATTIAKPPSTSTQATQQKVLSLVAGTALAGLRAVMGTPGGRAIYPSLLNAEDGPAIVGITLNNVRVGGSAKIVSSGPISNPTWTWTPQQKIYVGEQGVLVTTIPQGLWVVQIGVALLTNRIWVSQRTSILT